MDGLETTYEDSVPVEFIDCGICNKSIRGDTLYKIHLTTIQHLKFQLLIPTEHSLETWAAHPGNMATTAMIRESALVATGQAIWDHEVPDFKDIKEYFQYLKLDEPIIGLSLLNEVSSLDSTDPQPGPRYFCKLCEREDNLPNMANHVIGRRHRQKYLEFKRKDLVTWDKTSMLAQPGKVVRAKALVVERQDGQGSPKRLRKNRNMGNANLSQAPMKQRRAQDLPQGVDLPPLPSYLMERRDHHQERFPRNHLSAGYEEDTYSGERQVYLKEDHRRFDYTVEELQKLDYSEDDLHRQDFLEEGPSREEYLNEMQRHVYLEEGAPMHGRPEDFPPRQTYPDNAYPEEGPRRRPYPESDPLKQFYSQEVLRRGAERSVEGAQDRSFQKAEPSVRGYAVDDPQEPSYVVKDHHSEEGYLEDSHRRNYFEDKAHCRAYREEDTYGSAFSGSDPHGQSQDRDPSGHGYTKVADWQAHGVPEARGQRYPKQQEGDSSHSRDHLFELVKAFRQEGRSQRQEERSRHQVKFEHGPGGPGIRSPPSQRPPEGSRVRSDIPEPFRNFLSGAVTNRGPGKRKRKSRFSDATDEEIDMVKRMQVDGIRGPKTDLSAKPPGIYQGGIYTEARSKPMSDSSSDAGNVLDVLNNIEIENVEEANFLKEKLCSLLKEFQAKKSEKTVQKSQRPGVIKDYNHMSNEPAASTRGQYERTFREMPEERQYEIQSSRTLEWYPTKTPHRGRFWEEEEHTDKRGHESHSESRSAKTSRYEDVFGHVEQYPLSNARTEEPIMHQEMPEDSVYHRDYPSVPEDLYEPSNRDHGYRLRPAHFPTSLDKITSTLLELVARKS